MQHVINLSFSFDVSWEKTYLKNGINLCSSENNFVNLIESNTLIAANVCRFKKLHFIKSRTVRAILVLIFSDQVSLLKL